MSDAQPTGRRWKRLVRPAGRSIITFPTVPELFVAVPRERPEVTLADLPPAAVEIIAEANRLEEAEGGRGVVFLVYGSREEPERLVLRLVPKYVDEGAAGRLAKVRARLAEHAVAVIVD